MRRWLIWGALLGACGSEDGGGRPHESWGIAEGDTTSLGSGTDMGAGATDAGAVPDASTTSAGATTDGTVEATSGGESSSVGGDTTGEPLDEPRIHYFGRYDDSEPGRVRYGWSGAGFSARFDGTAVRVRMDDNARYHTIVVDGTVTGELVTSPGEQEYTLADGLPPGEHVVELHRQTEAQFGVTTVAGVEIEGELLPPLVPDIRMEVLGDSITCGFGNEGPDASCPFSAETENHYITYAAIAARAVGAELTTIAWSGKGVVFNYGTNIVDPLPALYDRTIPTEAGLPWVESESADLVLVNLGTNDFSTDGDPTEDQFVGAYVELLQAIRQRHPQAQILCTVAPILGGNDLPTVQSYIDVAIEQRAAAGDAAIERVDLIVPAQGSGCANHPSAATHQAMADVLIPIVQAALP